MDLRPDICEFIDFEQHQLIWICQRELQRKVANLTNNDENLYGNAALILLFLLGFPLVDMEEAQDDEVGKEETQEVLQEVNNRSLSKSYNSLNVGGYSYRVWTPLAPQEISLMLRIDLPRNTVSLGLRNDSGDDRFMWQDWVDSAMGYMKGFEESYNSDQGFSLRIVRADLRKPMA